MKRKRILIGLKSIKNQDKSLGILIPTQECIDLLGIEAIAKKDVPQDLPFWIVEDDFIPSWVS